MLNRNHHILKMCLLMPAGTVSGGAAKSLSFPNAFFFGNSGSETSLLHYRKTQRPAWENLDVAARTRHRHPTEWQVGFWGWGGRIIWQRMRFRSINGCLIFLGFYFLHVFKMKTIWPVLFLLTCYECRKTQQLCSLDAPWCGTSPQHLRVLLFSTIAQRQQLLVLLGALVHFTRVGFTCGYERGGNVWWDVEV